MTKTRSQASDNVARLAKELPRHQHHDQFLRTAVALYAKAVQEAADANTPVTGDEAMEGARADFDVGLEALFFDPDADRFAAVFRSRAWAGMLRPFIVAAWQSDTSKFGMSEPIAYDPKRKPTNHH